ncbi:MAG: response regulator transcription factor [Filomicrobium sp.]
MSYQPNDLSFLETAEMPESFLVIDDHPLFLDALKLAVHAAFPEADIDEANTLIIANDKLEAGGGYDMVLLDLNMPGTRGFDGLLDLRSRYPKLPVVIVSAIEDADTIHRAITCGAAGYIAKSVRKPELVEAIQGVMNGEVYLPPSYEPPDDADNEENAIINRLKTLTPQQLRVMKMLKQGLLNKQIAHELSVGETTVKAHVSEILRKLGVASRTQAVIEVSKISLGDESSAATDAG